MYDSSAQPECVTPLHNRAISPLIMHINHGIPNQSSRYYKLSTSRRHDITSLSSFLSARRVAKPIFDNRLNPAPTKPSSDSLGRRRLGNRYNSQHPSYNVLAKESKTSHRHHRSPPTKRPTLSRHFRREPKKSSSNLGWV